MGRNGKKWRMACVVCDRRAELTVRAAESAGWHVWIGGGTCPSCSNPEPVPPPSHDVRMPHEVTTVKCSVCDHVVEGLHNELEDGSYSTTIHWVYGGGVVRPYPLCPGWNKPGILISKRTI